MFEDSLVESRIDPVSASKRWTALAAFSLQFAIAAIVIALPLLHPEALRFHLDRPKVLLPLLPKQPLPMAHVEPVSAASTSIPAPKVAQMMTPLLPARDTAVNQVPTIAPIGLGMRMQAELPADIALSEGRSRPAGLLAPARAAGPLHISLGVLQGMLIAPIRPVYPAIAKAAHVEGTVVLEAIISRSGTIEGLHVVSGPPMLQRAAIDAIQAARYKPYRLNGETSAVETAITVNFRIGG